MTAIATRDLTSQFGQAARLLEYPFSVYFANSLFITFMTLAISLPITSMAAYANTKLMRGPSETLVVPVFYCHDDDPGGGHTHPFLLADA